MRLHEVIPSLRTPKLKIYRRPWIKANPEKTIAQLAVCAIDGYMAIENGSGQYLWTPRLDDFEATDWEVFTPEEVSQ
jgi:hypothetical protein